MHSGCNLANSYVYVVAVLPTLHVRCIYEAGTMRRVEAAKYSAVRRRGRVLSMSFISDGA